MRGGVRALPVAEELAFRPARAGSRRNDRDEPALAAARQVNRPRVHLFAGAGLAQDQKLAVRRSEPAQAIATRAPAAGIPSPTGPSGLDSSFLMASTRSRRQPEDADVVADEHQRAVVQRRTILDANVVDPGPFFCCRDR